LELNALADDCGHNVHHGQAIHDSLGVLVVLRVTHPQGNPAGAAMLKDKHLDHHACMKKEPQENIMTLGELRKHKQSTIHCLCPPQSGEPLEQLSPVKTTFKAPKDIF